MATIQPFLYIVYLAVYEHVSLYLCVNGARLDGIHVLLKLIYISSISSSRFLTGKSPIRTLSGRTNAPCRLLHVK